jgi:hypothetical protein
MVRGRRAAAQRARGAWGRRAARRGARAAPRGLTCSAGRLGRKRARARRGRSTASPPPPRRRRRRFPLASFPSFAQQRAPSLLPAPPPQAPASSPLRLAAAVLVLLAAAAAPAAAWTSGRATFYGNEPWAWDIHHGGGAWTCWAAGQRPGRPARGGTARGGRAALGGSGQSAHQCASGPAAAATAPPLPAQPQAPAASHSPNLTLSNPRLLRQRVHLARPGHGLGRRGAGRHVSRLLRQLRVSVLACARSGFRPPPRAGRCARCVRAAASRRSAPVG